MPLRTVVPGGERGHAGRLTRGHATRRTRDRGATMSTDPVTDSTAAEPRPRDLGQTIHQHTQQEVLDHLPQLTSFVMRQLRIHEGFGDFTPREVQPEEIIDAIVLEALE